MKFKPANTVTTARSLGALLKSVRGVLSFAALAGVLLILLHESLFMGKGLVAADAVLSWPPWNQARHPSNYLLLDQYGVFLPTQEFVHQQKSFPLWNPHLCCGVPNLGAIQGALLFPIRLLLSPLDPFSASGPAAFLKLCLAGWFTMLYVRLLGGSHAAALLAGLAFSLSGFMVVWLGHPHVNSAMWLPLLLYLGEKSFRQDGASVPRIWAGFAAAFACMILGGHPPTMIHVTIVVWMYFLFRLVGHRHTGPFRRVGWPAAASAIGLLLAAPQILPFLEYLRESSSAQASAATARWSSHLTLGSLIHFLLPNGLGNPAIGFADMPDLLGWHEADNFSETAGYVGILPLFFAACAISLRRCPFSKFFFLLALGCLLVICGVPPVPALMRTLPVLRDVNQERLLLIVGFCLAVLAGLGWDKFRRRQSRRHTLIVMACFCGVVGVALLCFWNVTGPKLHSLDEAHWAFLRRQFLILAGGMMVAVFLALWPARRNGWISMAACLCWTAGDLLCFGMGYNPSIPRDLYYPKTPAIEWLQKDPSLFRVFGGPTVLCPDTAEVFGLNDARGVDFMTVRRYEELITGQAGEFLFDMFPKDIPKTLRLLNVKYMLSAKAMALNPDFFQLVYSNEICIYRFKDCQERALLLFDYQVAPDSAAVLTRVSSEGFDPHKTLLLEDQPAPPNMAAGDRPSGTNVEGAVRILSYEPDDISLEASLPRPGFLLLLDSYFPGWSATVNGQPAAIQRADYNFRAASLPAGRSTILFSYRPQSLRIGLYLCAAGILALVALWFWPWKSRSGGNGL